MAWKIVPYCDSAGPVSICRVLPVLNQGKCIEPGADLIPKADEGSEWEREARRIIEPRSGPPKNKGLMFGEQRKGSDDWVTDEDVHGSGLTPYNH